MRNVVLLLATFCVANAQSYKDVAPIFAKYCSGCHVSTVKMGSLDIETEQGLKAGGNHGTIIVPGKPEESRLYLMITGKMKPYMPMDGTKLSAQELDTVKRWIDAGAKWEPVTLTKTEAPKIQPSKALKPQVFSLAYRSDGKLLALAGFKEVRLVDASGKLQGALQGHAEDVRAVAFSKDGKLLAAAGGWPARKGEVKIWDVDQRSVVQTIQGHADCIYAVAFSPDGRTLATSSYDKLIKLWDVATGKEIRTLKDHIDAVYALAFTPDGKRLVSGAADRTVKIWNPETGERLYTFGEPSDGINTLVISPDGKMVAAAGQDKTIRIWALGEKSGRLLNTLIAHEDAILKLAWSPDGKMLVSASADRTIKVFQASDLTELKSIAPQSDWIYGLEFAPDGKSFAAARFDGSLSIYDAERFVDHAEVRTALR